MNHKATVPRSNGSTRETLGGSTNTEARRTGTSSSDKSYGDMASAGLLLVAAILVPILFPGFLTSFGTQVLYYAVIALGLDLLMGYVGLYSLGQAAFIGVAGYAGALTAIHLTSNFFACLAIGVGVAVVLSLVMGALAVRQSGVGFIMLTLAFGQLVFALANGMRGVTNGSDGLSAMPVPTLGFGLDHHIDLFDQSSRYYLCLVMVILVWAFLRRLVRSPFGLALQGIRENGNRMRALGYNVYGFKLVAFVISGAIAGAGGVLAMFDQGIVTVANLNWSLSALILIAVMLGGIGRLYGALVGVLVVLGIQTNVLDLTSHWQLLLGLVFLVVMFLSRNGIVGLVDQGIARIRRGRR